GGALRCEWAGGFGGRSARHRHRSRILVVAGCRNVERARRGQRSRGRFENQRLIVKIGVARGVVGNGPQSNLTAAVHVVGQVVASYVETQNCPWTIVRRRVVGCEEVVAHTEVSFLSPIVNLPGPGLYRFGRPQIVGLNLNCDYRIGVNGCGQSVGAIPSISGLCGLGPQLDELGWIGATPLFVQDAHARDCSLARPLSRGKGEGVSGGRVIVDAAARSGPVVKNKARMATPVISRNPLMRCVRDREATFRPRR